MAWRLYVIVFLLLARIPGLGAAEPATGERLVERIMPRNLRAVSFAQGGEVGFVVADDGAILRSTDGGNSWTVLPAPPTKKTLYAVATLDRNHAIVAGENGVIARTGD